MRMDREISARVQSRILGIPIRIASTNPPPRNSRHDFRVSGFLLLWDYK